jgi:transposase
MPVVSFLLKNFLTMDKIKQFIGIDISKDSFDVSFSGDKHQSFENNLKGFKSFCKTIYIESHCVMEATGSYYQQLAGYLYDIGYAVSVVNPLVIKRYMQMKLQHNKTDKSDAKMIAKYAQEQVLKLWIPEPAYIEECKLLNSCIELYFKQSTALKNKLHSIQHMGYDSKKAKQSIKRQIKRIQNEILSLEEQLESLIRQYDGALLTNLTTIPTNLT